MYVSGTTEINARYNWWGDDSGPYHPTLNPDGLGNRVSDRVLFEPWLLAGGEGEALSLTETDYSTLIYEASTGSYFRLYPDGTQITFNPDGTHHFTLFPDGRKVAYTYNPDQSVATMQITAPGKTTPSWVWTFAYTNGRLSSITDPAQRVVRVTIDSYNHLVEATDADNSVRRFTYNAQGLMTNQTDENGDITSYEYDPYGRISRHIAPPHAAYNYQTGQPELRSLIRTFANSDTSYPLINASIIGDPTIPAPAVPVSENLVVGVTYGRGERSGITNAWGDWLEHSDGIDRTRRYIRDAANNILRRTFADGDCYEYSYDELGNVLTESRLDAATCALSASQRATLPLSTWTRTYEPLFNQLKSATDPEGFTTTYTYDYEVGSGSAGHLVQITYPSVESSAGDVVTPTIEFSYNTLGLLETLTDERGITTRFIYTQGTPDEASSGSNALFAPGATPVPGLLTQVIEDAGGAGHRNSTTVFKNFDRAGNPQLIIQARGERYQYQYDVLNRPVAVENGLTFRTTYEYDGRGNLVRLVDGNQPGSRNRVTTFTYNVYDQPLQTTAVADGIIWQETNLYDINRQLALHRDAQNRTTRYRYDDADQLTAMTDALGQTTSYAYSLRRELATQTYPDGRVITFAYDERQNLTTLTPPGRPVHEFAYTLRDLTSSYDPPSVGGGTATTEYFYNALGQLTREERPDGRQIEIAYDEHQRTEQVTVARGSYTFSYDPNTSQLNRVVAPGQVRLDYSYDDNLVSQLRWSGPVAGTVAMSYDAYYHLQTETVNGTPAVSFDYSADHLLERAGALTLSRADQSGLPERATLGNIVSQWAYNGYGEVTTAQTQVGNTAVFNTAYTYDALERIKTLTETIAGTTYTYDYTYNASGRLTEVKRNGTVFQTYAYDTNGNRIQARSGGVTVSGAYDNQDRLRTYGNATYSYTANGELATKVAGSSTTTYSYDELSNLTRVTLPNGTTIDYLIDGENRRVGKLVNGAFVQGLIYRDNLNPVAEVNSAGNVVSRFVYGSNVNVPDYMIKDGTTYRFVTDHLGSVRLVINTTSGAITQQINYDAFGRVTLDTNPGFQPFGFAGGIYDAATGLVRFGARDYDAETGRWTTKDPVGLGGGSVNFYSYAGNDPLNFIDPTGLWSVCVSYFAGLGASTCYKSDECGSSISFNVGIGIGAGWEVDMAAGPDPAGWRGDVQMGVKAGNTDVGMDISIDSSGVDASIGASHQHVNASAGFHASKKGVRPLSHPLAELALTTAGHLVTA